jgi:hypothetical protein
MAGYKITAGKRTAQIRKPEKLEQLAKDLKKKEKFAQFAKDPKKFVAKYGVAIDTGINDRLKRSLTGAKSLSDLSFKEEAAATIAAVASGRAAISSTKIAVVV